MMIEALSVIRDFATMPSGFSITKLFDVFCVFSQ
jgi:hypothetical protein